MATSVTCPVHMALLTLVLAGCLSEVPADEAPPANPPPPPDFALSWKPADPVEDFAFFLRLDFVQEGTCTMALRASGPFSRPIHLLTKDRLTAANGSVSEVIGSVATGAGVQWEGTSSYSVLSEASVSDWQAEANADEASHEKGSTWELLVVGLGLEPRRGSPAFSIDVECSDGIVSQFLAGNDAIHALSPGAFTGGRGVQVASTFTDSDEQAKFEISDPVALFYARSTASQADDSAVVDVRSPEGDRRYALTMATPQTDLLFGPSGSYEMRLRQELQFDAPGASVFLLGLRPVMSLEELGSATPHPEPAGPGQRTPSKISALAEGRRNGCSSCAEPDRLPGDQL